MCNSTSIEHRFKKKLKDSSIYNQVILLTSNVQISLKLIYQNREDIRNQTVFLFKKNSNKKSN